MWTRLNTYFSFLVLTIYSDPFTLCSFHSHAPAIQGYLLSTDLTILFAICLESVLSVCPVQPNTLAHPACQLPLIFIPAQLQSSFLIKRIRCFVCILTIVWILCWMTLCVKYFRFLGISFLANILFINTFKHNQVVILFIVENAT